MSSTADKYNASPASAAAGQGNDYGGSAASGGGKTEPTAAGYEVLIKSELIQILAQRQSQLNFKDVELAVKTVLEQMALALSRGKRIELRGFGSFSLHRRPERQGRNPMTGDTVHLPVNYVPHFKPGKILKWRVDLPENKGRSKMVPRSSRGDSGAISCSVAVVPVKLADTLLLSLLLLF